MNGLLSPYLYHPLDQLVLQYAWDTHIDEVASGNLNLLHKELEAAMSCYSPFIPHCSNHVTLILVLTFSRRTNIWIHAYNHVSFPPDFWKWLKKFRNRMFSLCHECIQEVETALADGHCLVFSTFDPSSFPLFRTNKFRVLMWSWGL